MVVWFILWIVLVSDTPEKSSRALEEEKVYLEDRMHPRGIRDKGVYYYLSFLYYYLISVYYYHTTRA